jgi:hypothetical protein
MEVFEDIVSKGFSIIELEENIVEQIKKVLENSNKLFINNENPTEFQKSIGVGYNNMTDIKEVIQIRVGNKMEYPKGISKEMEKEIELLYELLDSKARVILKDLIKESKLNINFENLQQLFDPSIDFIKKNENYISSSVLDLNNYINTEKSLKKHYCPSHIDQGVITISIECNSSSLQVYKPSKKSNWTFCQDESKKDSYNKCVVLTGEQLSLLTQRNINPTIHRVKNMNEDRFSIVFKLRTRPEVFGPMNDTDYRLIKLQKGIKCEKYEILKKEKQKKLNWDIIRYISTEFLQLEEILILRLVCKDWLNLIDDNQTWRTLYFKQ